LVLVICHRRRGSAGTKNNNISVWQIKEKKQLKGGGGTPKNFKGALDAPLNQDN
jgi:hypothetical protein